MKTLHPLSLGESLPEALGESEAFLAFQERLARVAPVQRPVLIVGERGTGKELAAIRLHFLSGRWQRPLVTLNCAALASGLIETELFGYERGAFTGAVERRIGRFEAANGGTLFLDEIGNVPLEVQEKLLRAVEYRVIERVGGAEPVRVDVRIVAATHADLPAMAAAGAFRRDLLDRLSFEVLRLPPLRERAGDVFLLAEHFARAMAAELGRPEPSRFSAEALAALRSYPFPGNVRELKNVIERAVYRAAGPVIRELVFDPFGDGEGQGPKAQDRAQAAPPGAPSLAGGGEADLLDRPLPEAVAELKRRMLARALAACRWNQRRAAARLGLSYDSFRSLYRRLRETIPPSGR